MQKITKKESGFTLVELMVAITLGFILTFAVIQTFFATRQTARANDGVARIQENARFSLQFMTEDIRNSGYAGCVGRIRNKLIGDPTEFLSFANPMFGWEASGTQPGNGGTGFELTSAVGANGNWTGIADSPLPDYLNGQLIAGSDVIGISTFRRVNAAIVESDNSSRTITTEVDHGVDVNGLVLVGDCWESELFQNSTGGSVLTAPEDVGTPGNRPLATTISWLRPYQSNDALFELGYKFYFVSEGASGLPSLFSFETKQPLSSLTLPDVIDNRSELVEGIESMQILYGEDIDNVAAGGAGLDGNPDRYISANEVEEWANVVSARVGLLLRSPNNATDIDQQDSYVLLDDITISDGANDAVLRYLINTTVKLRNKALGSEVAPFVCDAGTANCI